jgi:uncharacterized protein YkwD
MNKTKWEQLKKDVAKEHSKIRKNPKSYIPLLEKVIKYFKGKVIYKPGETAGLITNEGKSAYEECIQFLKVQKPVGELIYDEELSRAAQDHADDIGPAGICDHYGADGSSMDERVERYVEWDKCISENIDFGANTAEDIIISLIVDDGIPERGHRKNIFQPEIKYIGVGIAEHSEYRICTILDYIGGINGYKKNSSSKKPAKNTMVNTPGQYHTVKETDVEDLKMKKLKELIINNNKKNCSYESNLDDEFGKKVNISNKKDKNQKVNLGFPDDPDAPEGAIACEIKIQTKTTGKKTEKKTIKTYTLQDGNQEIIEIVETYN